jgi:hypothetical protein
MEGPNVRLIPPNTRFSGVRVEDVSAIVDLIVHTLAERAELLRPKVPLDDGTQSD